MCLIRISLLTAREQGAMPGEVDLEEALDKGAQSSWLSLAGVYLDKAVAFLEGLSSGTSKLLIAWYVMCESTAEAWIVLVFSMPARIVKVFRVDFAPIINDLNVGEQDLVISVP
jgi:hypothetical protein